MSAKFVQIATAHTPGGTHVLYALDDAGQVWQLEAPPGGSWTRVTPAREA